MGSHVHDFRSGLRVTGSHALQIGRQKPEREIQKKEVGKHERHKKAKYHFAFLGVAQFVSARSSEGEVLPVSLRVGSVCLTFL